MVDIISVFENIKEGYQASGLSVNVPPDAILKIKDSQDGLNDMISSEEVEESVQEKINESFAGLYGLLETTSKKFNL